MTFNANVFVKGNLTENHYYGSDSRKYDHLTDEKGNTYIVNGDMKIVADHLVNNNGTFVETLNLKK